MTNEGPQEDRAGSWSHTQRISYRADIRDAGEFLHCYSEQTDDQGTVTRHTGAGEAARFYLSVKMTLEHADMQTWTLMTPSPE